MRSISSATIAKYRSPASVSTTPRPTLVKRDVPKSTSSSWICWLTADGVTFSSVAALEMPPARATA